MFHLIGAGQLKAAISGTDVQCSLVLLEEVLVTMGHFGVCFVEVIQERLAFFHRLFQAG